MCGLFAIINHHKRILDKRAFITLGCINDDRGGDACGIMIDGQVERGTEVGSKYFQGWYDSSKLLKETNKCYVALGHCRKASVGGAKPEGAQPVTITDENGKMLYCLIHNGTIYNYEELAKKYIPEVDIKGLTDSQVMARIFYHAGYDALSEYKGGGAFIIQDYRVNKTFLFRGESLGTLNAKTPSKERSLYIVLTGKSAVISSMCNVLQGLYWGFPVYDVPSNELLECDGLRLYVVKKYDRSQQIGYKTYSTTTGTTKGKVKETSNSFVGAEGAIGFLEFAGSSNNEYSKIRFSLKDGKYYNTDTKTTLHGVINVTPMGWICEYSTAYTNKYYFWNGIMLCGESAYIALRRFLEEGGRYDLTTEIARRLSYNPVCINNKWFQYGKDNKREVTEDSWIFPLTSLYVVYTPTGKFSDYDSLTSDCTDVPVSLPTEKIENIMNYVKTHLQRNRK